jgi:hypothetical protein
VGVSFECLGAAIRGTQSVYMEACSLRSPFSQSEKIFKPDKRSFPSFKDQNLRGAAFDSLNTSWKCFGFANNIISEVPESLKLLCARMDDYYVGYYNCNRGFWKTVLLGLDPSILLKTENDQDSDVSRLKHVLACKLDEYYLQRRYRMYGYVRSHMLEILLDPDPDRYHVSTGHFVSDFFGINICVMEAVVDDRSRVHFYWMSPYRKNLAILVLHKVPEGWGTVMHRDGKSHLFKDNTRIMTYFEPTNSLKNTQRPEMTPHALKELKRQLRAMSMKEVQAKAEQLEMAVYNTETGKQKLKAGLIEEIFETITGTNLKDISNKK